MYVLDISASSSLLLPLVIPPAPGSKSHGVSINTVEKANAGTLDRDLRQLGISPVHAVAAI